MATNKKTKLSSINKGYEEILYPNHYMIEYVNEMYIINFFNNITPDIWPVLEMSTTERGNNNFKLLNEFNDFKGLKEDSLDAQLKAFLLMDFHRPNTSEKNIGFFVKNVDPSWAYDIFDSERISGTFYYFSFFRAMGFHSLRICVFRTMNDHLYVWVDDRNGAENVSNLLDLLSLLLKVERDEIYEMMEIPKVDLKIVSLYEKQAEKCTKLKYYTGEIRFPTTDISKTTNNGIFLKNKENFYRVEPKMSGSRSDFTNFEILRRKSEHLPCLYDSVYTNFIRRLLFNEKGSNMVFLEALDLNESKNLTIFCKPYEHYGLLKDEAVLAVRNGKDVNDPLFMHVMSLMEKQRKFLNINLYLRLLEMLTVFHPNLSTRTYISMLINCIKSLLKTHIMPYERYSVLPLEVKNLLSTFFNELPDEFIRIIPLFAYI
jgi:hypothetical protein